MQRLCARLPAAVACVVRPAATPTGHMPSSETAEQDEIPKWPIYAFIGVVFIGAPLMPQTKGGGMFARVVDVVYKRVGAAGLLGIPFATLTMEKSTYDTYCAYHGHSIYEAKENNPNGGFPSGGAALPSFSLLKTRAETERATFRSAALDRAWCLFRGHE